MLFPLKLFLTFIVCIKDRAIYVYLFQTDAFFWKRKQNFTDSIFILHIFNFISGIYELKQ